MNSVPNSLPTASVAALRVATSPAEWRSPISASDPCGPTLEYDHEYAVLLARMVPRADTQYGSFVGSAEAPNWPEIERDCQRLLLRTKDINLFVWLCRARTRLGQGAGLVQVLSMLLEVLQTWPEAVHPQTIIEGEPEPVVRANALAGLADPEGLLADVCEIVVASGTATRLTVRDAERAFAVPRMPEALRPESVLQQLAVLRAAAPQDARLPVRLLAEAANLVRAIEAWSKSQLGDDAPSLVALSRVLDLFIDPKQSISASNGAGPYESLESTDPTDSAAQPWMNTSPFPKARSGARQALTRDDVLLDIRGAREWFESHEPSSPVAVLLKQAERMVGKRFSQVADSIPLDLLQKWESEDDVPGSRE
ncbi:type VI secretion system ImpA family N-terminal domain-containing protein [soil metagenome]